MVNYIGCALFALFFWILTAQTTGTLQQRMMQTFRWIHGWAPFSYLIILVIFASGVISIKTMLTWPEYVEPEDPMAKYRREAEGLQLED
jgi:hypothetical protein